MVFAASSSDVGEMDSDRDDDSEDNFDAIFAESSQERPSEGQPVENLQNITSFRAMFWLKNELEAPSPALWRREKKRVLRCASS